VFQSRLYVATCSNSNQSLRYSLELSCSFSKTGTNCNTKLDVYSRHCRTTRLRALHLNRSGMLTDHSYRFSFSRFLFTIVSPHTPTPAFAWGPVLDTTKMKDLYRPMHMPGNPLPTMARHSKQNTLRSSLPCPARATLRFGTASSR
jgi:hypothetical protein